MGDAAKILIILGAVLIVIGLVMLGIQKLPLLGKLPGDIFIKRGNYSFYFPLTTSIIVSILVSLVLYFIGKFR
jgi:uncharacterized protein HemY